MSSFNKVILLGNVTRNPEIRYSAGNSTAIGRTGLAVNHKYKSGGELKSETMFIDIVAFGRQAEIMGEYVTKGSPLMIDGRLNFRQWEQDGVKRSKHEVIVETLRLMGGRKDSTSFGGEQDTGFDDDFALKSGQIEEDDIPF